MRKKEKNWVKVNFSLDEGIAKRLKDLAEFEEMNNSEFVELLVMRWDEGTDPETKLNSLLNEQKKISGEMSEINIKIKEVSDQITLSRDLKRRKSKKIPEALSSIERLLIGGSIQEAERIAKYWQSQTGTSALELLMEARDNIKDKGI